MATDPPVNDSKKNEKNDKTEVNEDTASFSTLSSRESSTATSGPTVTARPSWEWAWPWTMAPAAASALPRTPSSMEAGGMYLRGVAVPNSPARRLSEWQRSLRGNVRDKSVSEPQPALLKIFQNAQNWFDDDDDVSKSAKGPRKIMRRSKLTRPELDDEQASGYVSEDEEPEADKGNQAIKTSDPESPEDGERRGEMGCGSILKQIDNLVERSQLPGRQIVPLQRSHDSVCACDLADWEPEPLGPLPTPDELVANRAGHTLTLPLAALHQRRRSSQLAARRLQAIRQEIDSKLAEIEGNISKDHLSPERLTYAYIMHKCRSIVGDAESSDDDQRDQSAYPARDEGKVWAGGAAGPMGPHGARRRPLTAPLALMRQRLAGAAVAAGLLEEEQPASMPATGDEASTTSPSPDSRSPAHSRRRRVRKASAGRQRSREPPGSSSSSSVSSSPSSHVRSARGHLHGPLSPLHINPGNIRKRSSAVGVSGTSTVSQSPMRSMSFPTKRKF